MDADDRVGIMDALFFGKSKKEFEIGAPRLIMWLFWFLLFKNLLLHNYIEIIQM